MLQIYTMRVKGRKIQGTMDWETEKISFLEFAIASWIKASRMDVCIFYNLWVLFTLLPRMTEYGLRAEIICSL